MKQILMVLGGCFLLTATSHAQDRIFENVPRHHWSIDALEYLARIGINNDFSPKRVKSETTLTRYDISIGIARSLDKSESSQQSHPNKIAFNSATIRDVFQALVFEYKDELVALGTRDPMTSGADEIADYNLDKSRFKFLRSSDWDWPTYIFTRAWPKQDHSKDSGTRKSPRLSPEFLSRFSEAVE